MQQTDLPIMVEGLIFKKDAFGYTFLCLKRTEEEGGWWQPLVGHMQSNESLEQALIRELYEETGITKYVEIISDIWHFHWEYKSEMHLEFVFGINVTSDQDIHLNPLEHSEYRWCTIDEAIELFRFENNKEALQQFKQQYIKK